MQFKRRCQALHRSVGVSVRWRRAGRQRRPAAVQATVHSRREARTAEHVGIALLSLLSLLAAAGPLSARTSDRTALSLTGIPNFRLPSAGVVNTVFPAATGGRTPYTYSLSGQPPGITFSPSTRVASGTLPTVTTDTTYTVTYSVRDSRGVTDSTSFTATVTARRVVIGRPPDPPPTEDPDPPPPATVVRVHRLPFTVSETGEGEKSYSFRLTVRTDVSVSLTGMNRDIDCRVNGSSCTNRSGTSSDSWSGTLAAGTHTVAVYSCGGGSGNWTLSVSGTATSPPPPTPPPPPPPTTGSGPIVKTGVNVSSSRTYLLRLSGRVEVSVELTGMTTDFDCRVSGNRCTNRGGTRDDSWSGTLDAGDHKIVVYPYGGGSGSYTLTVSAEAPSTGGSTGTRTQVTTLVDVRRTGVSTGQIHRFTLAGPAEVEVALTGLSIDFDCRVGASRCTNRGSTRDDSWSGDLAAGNHSVVVYPYDPGPGNYSLTVTATETVNSVTTPLGGGPPHLRLLVCEGDEDGGIFEDTCVEIVVPGGGPGQGTPGPGDGGDGGDGGGGGDDDDDDDEETPEDELTNLCYADLVRDSTKVTSNPLENRRRFDMKLQHRWALIVLLLLTGAPLLALGGRASMRRHGCRTLRMPEGSRERRVRSLHPLWPTVPYRTASWSTEEGIPLGFRT